MPSASSVMALAQHTPWRGKEKVRKVPKSLFSLIRADRVVLARENLSFLKQLLFFHATPSAVKYSGWRCIK